MCGHFIYEVYRFITSDTPLNPATEINVHSSSALPPTTLANQWQREAKKKDGDWYQFNKPRRRRQRVPAKLLLKRSVWLNNFLIPAFSTMTLFATTSITSITIIIFSPLIPNNVLLLLLLLLLALPRPCGFWDSITETTLTHSPDESLSPHFDYIFPSPPTTGLLSFHGTLRYTAEEQLQFTFIHKATNPPMNASQVFALDIPSEELSCAATAAATNKRDQKDDMPTTLTQERVAGNAF